MLVGGVLEEESAKMGLEGNGMWKWNIYTTVLHADKMYLFDDLDSLVTYSLSFLSHV